MEWNENSKLGIRAELIGGALKLVTAVILVPILFVSPLLASDTLLRAVGFAITGRDDALVEVIDTQNCVFKIGERLYRLNNIELDRLFVREGSVKNSPGRGHFVEVELHGTRPIYEYTDPGMAILPTDSQILKELKEVYLKSHTGPSGPEKIEIFNQTYQLDISETDRVVRAWKYIYANGCSGEKSPF